ncbi:hypothetical protein T12_15290 [Trichinella patagoniensis]|uniref:Uncharacterized protein n=1 Tax=Trichinella patagoniensis TaxID=990121 RepID=A0A0V0ZD66_9BILA|nr:hypothetical protein T12_15290 [Trichinella patagoniensis]
MNIWNGNLNSSDAKRCGSETAAACRVDQTGPAKASCNSTVGISIKQKIHDNVKTNRRWQARHWPQLAAQRTCLSQEQAWTDCRQKLDETGGTGTTAADEPAKQQSRASPGWKWGGGRGGGSEAPPNPNVEPSPDDGPLGRGRTSDRIFVKL